MNGDAMAAIIGALEQIGLEHRPLDGRTLATAVPCGRRGPLRVTIALGERTLILRAFVLRAPDRNHEVVQRRLLMRNHRVADMAGWSFSMDEAGDIFLVARPELESAAADLDGLLGALSGLVDATWPGLVETGFTIPPRPAPPT